MKKYKLIRNALFTSIASLVLTTTGCGVDNTLKNRYIAVINNEVKILEEEQIIGGKTFSYNDIITKEKYKDIENIKIKGSLVQYLNSEQINAINGKDYYLDEFEDEDWIELINSISNKYRGKWCLDFTSEELSNKEKDIYLDEYNSLIPSDNLYILDTYFCEIENEDIYKVDRYYLIMDNNNPINNNFFDKERVLFNSNFNKFYYSFYEYESDKDYNLRVEIKANDKDEALYFRKYGEEKAVFNINEFFDKYDIKNKKNKYSVKELEELMKSLNSMEVEKIDESRIYVFDATKSNIDIISFDSNKDISSLSISDYYILIKDINSNTFDTLSNNDMRFSNGIYIDNDVLISNNDNFMFKTDVDKSYNLTSINEFLTSIGLGEYISSEYSDLELEHINSGLNQIRIKNISRGLSK